MFKNILVPMSDKTKCDDTCKTLEKAIQLCSGELVLLHVAEPLAQVIGGDARAELEAETKSEGLRIMGPAIEKLQTAGIPFHTRIVRGTPAETIVSIADEEKADLIVMFTNGRDEFADLLLGSVTERVLRNTGVDLLVVHE